MLTAGRLGRRPPRRAGDTEALLERIRRSVIGDDLVLDGPFGPRRLVYADYTASGRALSFVEDFIRHRVLPAYANTHTEATATGSSRMEQEILEGHLGAKLSFTRIGLPYFADDTVVDYLVQAVHLLAEHGWRLLPQYDFDPVTGLWTHHRATVETPVALTEALTTITPPRPRPDRLSRVLARQLAAVREVFATARQDGGRGPGVPRQRTGDGCGCEPLRWFPMPADARHDPENRSALPFACPPADAGTPSGGGL